MNLNQLFSPLIREADGSDVQQLLSEIAINPNQKYFVDAQGFTIEVLRVFIGNPNCSIVFHKDDGFSQNQRSEFLADLPFSASPDQVIIVEQGLATAELNTYQGLGAMLA